VDKFKPRTEEEGLVLSSNDVLFKWAGIGVRLITDCLLDNDQELFKDYMKKNTLPKSMFVSEYAGTQHVNRHVDRESVIGSVIVAMNDSEEQLTMWPGGYQDSSRASGSARGTTQTSWLNKAGNAVVFLSGVPHELSKPKRTRTKPRYVLVMFF
jgi:hypothetical protein